MFHSDKLIQFEKFAAFLWECKQKQDLILMHN